MTTCGDLLLEAFAKRQRKNAAYSLRAFARDLGMHPGTLGAVLANKRNVPRSSVDKLCLGLGLSPRARARFQYAAQRWGRLDDAPPPPVDKQIIEDSERNYRILAEWEHYAVLTLMDSDSFRSDSAWIAARFGISRQRVVDVLGRLTDAGLIAARADGTLVKTAKPLATSEDVESAALRAAHAEELDLAKTALAGVATLARDISSMTLLLDPKDLPVAKQMLREFRRRFANQLEGEGAGEVYQLNLQLFPLTLAASVKASTGMRGNDRSRPSRSLPR